MSRTKYARGERITVPTLSQISLDESLRGRGKESDEHLWIKQVLLISDFLGQYTTVEEKFGAKFPDIVEGYPDYRPNRDGCVHLPFWSVPSDVHRQVLYYLRRGYVVHILVPDCDPEVENSILRDLDAVTSLGPNFRVGRFSPSEGWFVAGDRISLNQANYEICPEFIAPKGCVYWAEEMLIGGASDGNWSAAYVEPYGYDMGTFMLPSHDETPIRLYYEGKEERSYVTVRAQEEEPVKRHLSMHELWCAIKKGCARVGPAMGIWERSKVPRARLTDDCARTNI